jgi:hypothetical protein
MFAWRGTGWNPPLEPAGTATEVVSQKNSGYGCGSLTARTRSTVPLVL